MATRSTLPVGEIPVVPHALAVLSLAEPVPKLNTTPIPRPLSVSQVPVVSPVIVIVLYSQVFATLMVKGNGYLRLACCRNQ